VVTSQVHGLSKPLPVSHGTCTLENLERSPGVGPASSHDLQDGFILIACCRLAGGPSPPSLGSLLTFHNVRWWRWQSGLHSALCPLGKSTGCLILSPCPKPVGHQLPEKWFGEVDAALPTTTASSKNSQVSGQRTKNS
jgi:hypothetical protein